MNIQADFSKIIISINNLSYEEKRNLSKVFSSEQLDDFFRQMREEIALEVKRRIIDRIAVTFIMGYGNGNLMNSIYTKIDGENITISSTKNYFEILNKGFAAFDMKAALLGKNVKMRLPGGRVIYRKVQDNGANLNLKRKKFKNAFGSHNWWHPGYKGADIYGQVAKEMEFWINIYVQNKVNYLLNIIRTTKITERIQKKLNHNQKSFNKTTQKRDKFIRK